MLQLIARLSVLVMAIGFGATYVMAGNVFAAAPRVPHADALRLDAAFALFLVGLAVFLISFFRLKQLNDAAKR